MLLLGWAGPTWGVRLHGPIPDPFQPQAEGKQDGHQLGSEEAQGAASIGDAEHEGEVKSLPTAAERVRMEQYDDARDGNPWFERQDANRTRPGERSFERTPGLAK